MLSPSAKDMSAADSNRNLLSPIVQRSLVHAHSMGVEIHDRVRREISGEAGQIGRLGV